MEITQQTSTKNTTVKTGRKIEYIVIHYTAGIKSSGKSASNTANWFATGDTTASSDFIVDDEHVIQYNPDISNRYAKHCGGSKLKTSKGGSFYGKCTNVNSIGIEMCSTNSTGKIANANDSSWSFTDRVIANAVELVKQLMSEYDIDIDHVIRHYDVTGKYCPGIIGWNADTDDESAWNDFKSKLSIEDANFWKNKYLELVNQLQILLKTC